VNILDFEVPPRLMQAFHVLQVALWLVMIPVALYTGLKDSVPFLVLVSILALVFSELAAWQSSLAERRLDKQDKYGDAIGESE
jgi:hypothetical protein